MCAYLMSFFNNRIIYTIVPKLYSPVRHLYAMLCNKTQSGCNRFLNFILGSALLLVNLACNSRGIPMYFSEGFEWYVSNLLSNRRSSRDKSSEHMSLEKNIFKIPHSHKCQYLLCSFIAEDSYMLMITNLPCKTNNGVVSFA